MANFETDLARMLARAERDEDANESDRALIAEVGANAGTVHVDGESARFIAYQDVADADANGTARRWGGDQSVLSPSAWWPGEY